MGKGGDFEMGDLCPSPGEAWERLKELGNKILGCICCMLCTGPILTLIGFIILMTALKDTRGDNIKGFNAGVDTWAAIQPVFAGMDPNAFTTAPTTMTEQVTDTKYTYESDADKVKAYTPTFYTATGDPGPNNFPITFSATQGFTATTNIDVTQTGGPVISYTVTVCRSRAQSQATSSTTGAPPPPPVYKAQKADRVCLKVAGTTAGGFTASSLGGGEGCWAGVRGASTSGVIYTDCTACETGAQPASTYNLNLEIRHQDDPIIAAWRGGYCEGIFTESASNGERCGFGLSRVQKFLIGLIILIIGVTWTCCVYGGIYALIVQIVRKAKQ